MSKRKLTNRQQSRIKKRQSDRIDTIDQKDVQNNEILSGLVVARYSRHIDVKALDGNQTDHIIRCHVRANIDSVTVGDKVAWSHTKDGKGIVVAVFDRSSVIFRPDGLGKLKAIAANINQVFIVIAPKPDPHSNLIDRYLIAAENAGIEAHIIINKQDLVVDCESASLSRLIKTYQSLGYNIYTVSCHNGYGINNIQSALRNKVSIFAGQSGVGKSSLINQLIPNTDAKVGGLSHHVSKGRHTTTTATLFDVPEGGQVIDSPGIREFHLTHLSREEVFAGYREFQSLLGQCQFRDCKHEKEPGCAIQAFLSKNKMAESRILSLNYILNTIMLD